MEISIIESYIIWFDIYGFMINRKVSFILLKHGNQRETWKDWSARNMEDWIHPGWKPHGRGLKHGNQRETWKDGSARNIERLKVDDFHPNQTRKEANFACGYTWAAKQRRGIKKIALWAKSFSFHQFFRPPRGCQPTGLTCGPSRGVL